MVPLDTLVGVRQISGPNFLSRFNLCLAAEIMGAPAPALRGVMDTAVVFGMTIATFVGIFLISVCYVFVQRLAELGKKPPETVPAQISLTAVHP